VRSLAMAWEPAEHGALHGGSICTKDLLGPSAVAPFPKACEPKHRLLRKPEEAYACGEPNPTPRSTPAVGVAKPASAASSTFGCSSRDCRALRSSERPSSTD
jgi:hypothetical protein